MHSRKPELSVEWEGGLPSPLGKGLWTLAHAYRPALTLQRTQSTIRHSRVVKPGHMRRSKKKTRDRDSIKPIVRPLLRFSPFELDPTPALPCVPKCRLSPSKLLRN